MRSRHCFQQLTLTMPFLTRNLLKFHLIALVIKPPCFSFKYAKTGAVFCPFTSTLSCGLIVLGCVCVAGGREAWGLVDHFVFRVESIRFGETDIDLHTHTYT